jgi:thioredoxin-like negative regulator of GroEL
VSAIEAMMLKRQPDVRNRTAMPAEGAERVPSRGARAALRLLQAGAAAIDSFTSGGSRAALERASAIDPGNYRLHLRLAQSGKKQQRCAHAAAAHALFPHAAAAREAMQGCR